MSEPIAMKANVAHDEKVVHHSQTPTEEQRVEFRPASPQYQDRFSGASWRARRVRLAIAESPAIDPTVGSSLPGRKHPIATTWTVLRRLPSGATRNRSIEEDDEDRSGRLSRAGRTQGRPPTLAHEG